MNEVENKQKDWGLIALEQSKGLKVETQQDYDNIAEMCRDIKGRVKQIVDYWKPLKDSAYKQWKAVGLYMVFNVMGRDINDRTEIILNEMED